MPSVRCPRLRPGSPERQVAMKAQIGVGVAFMAVVAVNLLVPGVDYARSVMNYFAAFFAGAWLWPHRDRVLSPGRGLLVLSSVAFVVLAALFASISSPSIAVAAGVVAAVVLLNLAWEYAILTVLKRQFGSGRTNGG